MALSLPCRCPSGKRRRTQQEQGMQSFILSIPSGLQGGQMCPEGRAGAGEGRESRRSRGWWRRWLRGHGRGEHRPRVDKWNSSKTGRGKQGGGRRFDDGFTIRNGGAGFAGVFADFSGNRHRIARGSVPPPARRGRGSGPDAAATTKTAKDIVRFMV